MTGVEAIIAVHLANLYFIIVSFVATVSVGAVDSINVDSDEKAFSDN
jgi:hypothetical protein